MSFFAIEYCAVKACLNWRLGNNCAKNKMYIPNAILYIANLHNSENCEARRQINDYRLKSMLEGKNT